MQRSDHFDGRRFFNPTGAGLPSFASVARMLRTKRTAWPDRVDITQRRPPERASGDEVIVTFIGHASFLIQTADGNILVDPVYAQRAGPFGILGPRRVSQPGVAFENLPPITVVFVSHNHYDHCDLKTLRAVEARFSPLFIAPCGNRRLLRGAGARRIEELDWWEKSTQAPFDLTLTPAQHFAARTPFDRNKALWGGFVCTTRGHTIYYAGDTGYSTHFREIRKRLGPMDAAIIPIGAYEPRWFMKPLHLNPDDAVQVHADVGARQSIASHFGTFRLTAEGIDAPVHALREACAARSVPHEEFRALAAGESIVIR
jgi:L-ascorbate metabolism protein UlaG (beta-lactamase superfamily)